jgi:hypothetical protein
METFMTRSHACPIEAHGLSMQIYDEQTRAALTEIKNPEQTVDGGICAVGIFFDKAFTLDLASPRIILERKAGDALDQPAFRDLSPHWQSIAARAALHLIEDDVVKTSAGPIIKERIEQGSEAGVVFWATSAGAVIEDCDLLYDKMVGRTVMPGDQEISRIARYSFLVLVDDASRGIERLKAVSSLQSTLSWIVRSFTPIDPVHEKTVRALAPIELHMPDENLSGWPMRWARHGRSLCDARNLS